MFNSIVRNAKIDFTQKYIQDRLEADFYLRVDNIYLLNSTDEDKTFRVRAENIKNPRYTYNLELKLFFKKDWTYLINLLSVFYHNTVWEINKIYRVLDKFSFIDAFINVKNGEINYNFEHKSDVLIKELKTRLKFEEFEHHLEYKNKYNLQSKIKLIPGDFGDIKCIKIWLDKIPEIFQPVEITYMGIDYTIQQISNLLEIQDRLSAYGDYKIKKYNTTIKEMAYIAENYDNLKSLNIDIKKSTFLLADRENSVQILELLPYKKFVHEDNLFFYNVSIRGQFDKVENRYKFTLYCTYLKNEYEHTCKSLADVIIKLIEIEDFILKDNT